MRLQATPRGMSQAGAYSLRHRRIARRHRCGVVGWQNCSWDWVRRYRRPPDRNRGAFIGNWLLPRLGVHLGTGIVSAIVNPTVGAVLLLLVVRLVGGAGGGTGRWG